MSKLDDGWVLVPKVPTIEWARRYGLTGNRCIPAGHAIRDIEAMLTAAPAPPAQSGAGEARKVTGLTAIAAVIRSWLDWDRAHRDKEFLTTDGDTTIMSLPVPFWPSHACFENWISTMIESDNRIATLSQAKQFEACSKINALSQAASWANRAEKAEAELAEAEKVMEPFDAIAATKGGTPQAEKLRAVICAILEQTPNGDLGALNEFCMAVLAARAWLERRRAEAPHDG